VTSTPASKYLADVFEVAMVATRPRSTL